MSLEDLTYGELSKKWQDARKAIKRYKDEIEKWEEFIKEVDVILQRRMVADGSTAVATEHGTIHTVGHTSARVMDPAATIAWLNEHQLWQDAVVLRINSSWARTHIEEVKSDIPGVELFTFRRLSISAPKPRTDDVK